MKNLIILSFVLMAFSCRMVVDIAQIEEELLLTDIEFSNLSAAQGFTSACAFYCDEDGVILRSGSYPVTGKAGVIKYLDERDDPGFRLTWEPQFAKVAVSGDLGYTYGIYTIKSETDPVLLKGTYVTIWGKKDQGWRFLLDSGNEGLGD